MNTRSGTRWRRFDHEIVEGLRSPNAERSALAARLYLRAYKLDVWRKVRRFCLDDAIADDVCQETFLTAIQKIRAGQYQSHEERCSRPWLLVIGHNKARTLQRSRGRERTRLRLYEHEPRHGAPSRETLPLSTRRMQGYVERLKPRHRRAVELLLGRGLYDVTAALEQNQLLREAVEAIEMMIAAEEADDVEQSK